MSLASQVWQRISIHDVVAEFLFSERHKLPQLPSADMMAVIENPDTKNPYQNHFRLRALLYIRCHLLGEIPPDTRWFEVRSLHDDSLPELRVIGRCGWDDPADHNELTEVAKRKALELCATPDSWRKPILWGHDRNGPFTIVEGNNRLVAYAASGAAHSLCIPVIVGLSATPCFFHSPDPPGVLANDLWKTPWPPLQVPPYPPTS